MTRPLVTVWRDALLSPNGLTATEKAVGLAVAKHADANGGSCWPSQNTIAAEAGCGLRTVQRALDALKDGGWMIVEKVAITGGLRGQAWRSTYQLTLPEEHVTLAGSSPEGDASVAGSSRKSTPNATEEGVTVTHEPVQELERQHTQEREHVTLAGSSERQRQRPTARGDGSPSSEPSSRSEYPPAFDAAWTAYPARIGSNSKPAAFRAWTERLQAGADPAELIEGVERYAAFCEELDRAGTRFVMAPARFFGSGEHWREEWATERPEEETRIDPDIFNRLRRA